MTLPFRIERTRNRSSRAVMVGDSVLIRLARGLSHTEEQVHIETLLRRISKSFIRNQSRALIDPFRPLLRGNPFLCLELAHGEMINFEVKEGTKTRAERDGSDWSITRASSTTDKEFHRFLWRLLSIACKPGVEQLVHAINAETLQVPIGKISLCLMSSQWGSSGCRGQIALSTPLLLTTSEILRYVIIHELAHVTHRNHSKKFWNLVGAHCLRVNEYRKKLKRYRLPQ